MYELKDFFNNYIDVKEKIEKRKNEDLEYKLKISTIQAKKGADIPIKYKFTDICKECMGNGIKENSQCQNCKGTGFIFRENTVTVTIPKKTKNNTVITIKNMGDLKEDKITRNNLNVIIKYFKDKQERKATKGLEEVSKKLMMGSIEDGHIQFNKFKSNK